MAFLKLGSAQSSLYENYEKVNTTALDRQVNYAVDTVRLNLASDKSNKLNPTNYDSAIANLQKLIEKPMSAAKRQDILIMIENYKFARNSLQEGLDKKAGDNKKSVAQIINEIKNQRQNEVDMTKAALLGVAKSPADYAKKMSEIVMGTDEDGQLDGTMMDVEKAIADQHLPVSRHNYDIEAINFIEFFFGSFGSSRHPRKLFIKSEIILESNGGNSASLLLNLYSLFGFYCLMKPFTPTTSWL